MKQINVSTSKMPQFAGQWVAIDTIKKRIIATAQTLKEIEPFVSSKKGQEYKIKASAFLVPRKDEGPYIL